MKIRSGIQPRPRRVLLYGIHGIGKGVWASDAPKPIFINLEDGLGDIDCDKTDPISSFREVSESLEWLATNDHPYRSVVIDTIDWLDKLIQKDVCNSMGVSVLADIDWGKGNAKCVPYWEWHVKQLDRLWKEKKMMIILLAHAKIEKFSPPDNDSYDRYSPAIHRVANSMLQEWCDEVFFTNYKIYTKQTDEGFNRIRTQAVGGKERLVYTSESAASFAKNRLNLPSEIPLDWSVYESGMRAFYQQNKSESTIVLDTQADDGPLTTKLVTERQQPRTAEPTSEDAIGVEVAGIVVNGTSRPEEQLARATVIAEGDQGIEDKTPF